MVKNTNSILFQDISQLIEAAKNHVARQTNSTLVHLYWQIGHRITQDILKSERAEYGNKIIKNLAQKLTLYYGRGFNARSLFKMVRFSKLFPNEIVPTVSALLSWSHFDELMALNDTLKRNFYTEMCRIEHWSVRELRAKIDSMLYERTAISHQPEKIIQQNLATLRDKNEISQELVFRDPYILDFLSLPSSFSESNLEYAILDEMCRFLEELGNDFCFIGRQKRISIDNDDYYNEKTRISRVFSHPSLRAQVGNFMRFLPLAPEVLRLIPTQSNCPCVVTLRARYLYLYL